MHVCLEWIFRSLYATIQLKVLRTQAAYTDTLHVNLLVMQFDLLRIKTVHTWLLTSSLSFKLPKKVEVTVVSNACVILYFLSSSAHLTRPLLLHSIGKFGLFGTILTIHNTSLFWMNARCKEDAKHSRKYYAGEWIEKWMIVEEWQDVIVLLGNVVRVRENETA